MDGVICNFVDAFMFLYQNGGGIVPDDWEWTDWSSMDSLPTRGVRDEVWKDPNLFWIQKPYEGAIKAMEILNDHYDVRIVTAVPHRHVIYRSQWVEHYMPFIHRKDQMIFTADKSLIQANIIIDDYLPHVYNWLFHNKGTGVVIDRPWNRDEVPYAHLHPRPYPLRMAELWELVERIGLAWGNDEAKEDESVG
jgi:5'(3')-deoxyribonucleotidase